LNLTAKKVALFSMQFKKVSKLFPTGSLFLQLQAASQVQMAMNTANTSATISLHIYGHLRKGIRKDTQSLSGLRIA